MSSTRVIRPSSVLTRLPIRPRSAADPRVRRRRRPRAFLAYSNISKIFPSRPRSTPNAPDRRKTPPPTSPRALSAPDSSHRSPSSTNSSPAQYRDPPPCVTLILPSTRPAPPRPPPARSRSPNQRLRRRFRPSRRLDARARRISAVLVVAAVAKNRAHLSMRQYIPHLSPTIRIITPYTRRFDLHPR